MDFRVGTTTAGALAFCILILNKPMASSWKGALTLKQKKPPHSLTLVTLGTASLYGPSYVRL